ncbi:MAG: hypothetical protein K1X94_28515 [Sandaracinaceae bacterium]|nr:hypothetical protein [Sandaracinaceae bacterium]
MALPLIRSLAYQIAPRLDAASLEASDVECMRAAIRASEAGNDVATRARIARLDALDVRDANAQLYIRTRFAYEIAYRRPGGPSEDRLDSLTPTERAVLMPEEPPTTPQRTDAGGPRAELRTDIDRYRFKPGDPT